MNQLLKLTNVDVNYGAFQALHDINIEVKKEELVVLLGANGAGKSTIFNTISGLNRPVNGEIKFRGKEIKNISPDRMVRLGVVQCSEDRHLFGEMSVEENLRLGGYIHRKEKNRLKESIQEVYELFPILQEKKDDMANSLSGGQQQMLTIGRALMSKPQMILMDEPSIGLAPLIVEQMFEIIQRINKNGVTVVLAEQNANAALKIADRGYVIENGVIVLEGSGTELLNNEEIKKAYIGA